LRYDGPVRLLLFPESNDRLGAELARLAIQKAVWTGTALLRRARRNSDHFQIQISGKPGGIGAADRMDND